ncbi:MAG: YHS domain-containing protein [Acidobacteriota bacterium]
MTSLARYLIIFVSALLLGRWLLKKLFEKAASRPGGPARKSGRQRAIQGQTFKDPQCGMYVASSLAVSQRVGEKEYHFCSPRCRDEFLAEQAHAARPRAQSL